MKGHCAKPKTLTLTEGTTLWALSIPLMHTHTHTLTFFRQGVLLLLQLHLATPALHAVGLSLQELQEPASVPLTH